MLRHRRCRDKSGVDREGETGQRPLEPRGAMSGAGVWAIPGAGGTAPLHPFLAALTDWA